MIVLIPLSMEQAGTALVLAVEIRKMGATCTVDGRFKNREGGHMKVGKKVTDAVKMGAEYVAVIGPDDVTNDRIKVKDLNAGNDDPDKETTIKLSEAARFIAELFIDPREVDAILLRREIQSFNVGSGRCALDQAAEEGQA